MDVRAQFATNLRRVRKLRKLSQEQLAASIGRSKETVSHLERAQSSPSLETLVLLHVALRVPLEELVGTQAYEYADIERQRAYEDLGAICTELETTQMGVLIQTGKALLGRKH